MIVVDCWLLCLVSYCAGLIVVVFLMWTLMCMLCEGVLCFFFQAEDGIRDAQESRGLGDVYKRQEQELPEYHLPIQ